MVDIIQNVKSELHSVWWLEGEAITVGKYGVTRIVLAEDGCGSMGYYDRIHVFNKDPEPYGTHQIHIAHNVSGFRLAEPEQTP